MGTRRSAEDLCKRLPRDADTAAGLAASRKHCEVSSGYPRTELGDEAADHDRRQHGEILNADTLQISGELAQVKAVLQDRARAQPSSARNSRTAGLPLERLSGLCGRPRPVYPGTISRNICWMGLRTSG